MCAGVRLAGYVRRGFVKNDVVAALGSPPLCGVNVKVTAPRPAPSAPGAARACLVLSACWLLPWRTAHLPKRKQADMARTAPALRSW